MDNWTTISGEKYFNRPRWQRWWIDHVWHKLQDRWPRVFGNRVVVVQVNFDTIQLPDEARERIRHMTETTTREVSGSFTVDYGDDDDTL